ncbi:hypothetical protein O9929_13815 [Vibrio lentus]|nr:hypothetical protein [Vibrio lentus]
MFTGTAKSNGRNKRALIDYPVYTRKEATDVATFRRARYLLSPAFVVTSSQFGEPQCSYGFCHCRNDHR